MPILKLAALLAAAALILAGCGADKASNDDTASKSGGGKSDSAASELREDRNPDLPKNVEDRNEFYSKAPSVKLDSDKVYVARMTTSEGTFDITLDQKQGPIAAANFAFLVREGFYDGVVFHRIIKEFMIQGGDPSGTGTGGPGYELKDDPVSGSYDRGIVAMANAGPNTGGSQFFIVHGKDVDQQLPKDYVIFGKVDEEGMKVVDKIAAVDVVPGPSGEPSQPTRKVVIESAELLVR